MSNTNKKVGKLTVGSTITINSLGDLSNSSGSTSLSSGADSMAVSSTAGVSFPKSTVTQITSISTGVTATKTSGVITTVSATSASGVSATFTVTNTTVAITDVIVCGVVGYSGTTGVPVVRVSAVSAGSFTVTLTNVHPTEALNGIVKVSFISV